MNIIVLFMSVYEIIIHIIIHIYLNSTLLTYSDWRVCITVWVEYFESRIFLIKRGNVEFSKYTIYSKYVNAAIGTTSCNYKISSSASLFETTHLQTQTSFHHYVMTTMEFCLSQMTETGKDTHHKQWEGRSEFVIWNRTESSCWLTQLCHHLECFPSKEGTSGGGVLLPLHFIFNFLHLSRTRCFIWKH